MKVGCNEPEKMMRTQTPNKKFKEKSTISKVRLKSEGFEISNKKRNVMV